MPKNNLIKLVAVSLALLSSSAFAQLMKLPGQFDVGSSGAATYTIPIQVPPGSAGMQPDISLSYSSQSGNGIMGLGWNLDGLPAIQRCARTLAQDGVKGNINFDSNDRFCLGGQRLVAISGTYGSNNTEYRTELESYSKIVSYGVSGSGPQSFKVWTKSGQILEFGGTTNSRFPSSGTVRTWLNDKVYDTAGNRYEVTYAGSVYIYPTRIDYTYNAAQSLSGYNSVRFEYDFTRPDQFLTYQSGASTQLFPLLKNVKTYEGSNVVHDYQISYLPDPSPVRHNRVTSIKQCDNGIPTLNCLPATTFTWPTANDPISQEAPIDHSSSGIDPGIAIGDYNGDGLPDFLRELIPGYDSSSTVKYWMSTEPKVWASQTKNVQHAKPSFPPHSLEWYTLTGHPADLNGDGYTDLVLDAMGSYLDETGFEDVSVPFGPRRESSNFNDKTGVQNVAQLGNGGANSLSLPFGDMNGDGRDDLLYLRASPNGAIPYYSNGNGTYTAGTTISGLYSSAVVFPGDFNGDGCMDILAQGTANKIYFTCYPTISGTTVTNWVGSGYKITPGDYNGDGNTDILLTHASLASEIRLSDGKIIKTATASGPSDWAKYQVHSGDFNGDGKADVALIAASTAGSNYGPTTTHKVYLSMGAMFQTSLPFLEIANPSGDVTLARVHDFNGDGVADIWIKKVGGSNKLYLTNYQPMLITKINDGLGQDLLITYKRLNDNSTAGGVYTKGTGATYPDYDVVGAQYVVSKSEVPNGVGTKNTSSFLYEGVKYHQQGRGLLGFRKVIVTDPSNIVTTTTYKQDYPYIGQIENIKQVFGSVTLRDVTNTFQNVTLTPAGTGGQRRQVKLYQTVEVSKDLNGASLPTITTTNTYDTYGNATQIVVSGSGGDTKTTTNTFSNSTTNWLIGRLLTTQTLHALTGKTSLTRKASFQYHTTTGLLTREVIEPGGGSNIELTTDYTRDPFGNILTKTESGSGLDPRQTIIEFDPIDIKGRFVTKITNPKGHVDRFEYDPRFGTVTTHTDPNSLVSTFVFDKFGRLTKETDPDGRYRNIVYDYCTGVNGGSGTCTSNGAMVVVSTPKRSGSSVQSGPAEAVIFDKLGRTIAVGNEMFNGTDWALSETIFDTLGRVENVTRPFVNGGSATQHTTFYYDTLARVTSSVTSPDSSTTTITYNGLTTTVTNGLGQKTKTVLNSQGLVYTVTEEGDSKLTTSDDLTTTYSYTAIGDLHEVTDPLSNKITNTSIDIRGRVLQRVDPSLGTWNYVYDVMDQLTQQTDAMSQVSTFAYDKLGRLTSLVAPGMTSTFVFDTATTGKGQLKEMSTSAGNKRIHTYDSLGRPSKTQLVIDSINYDYDYTYDSDARLNTVKYPSAYKVHYLYTNNQRYLQHLKEDNAGVPGNTLWTANTRNAAGQLTQATMNLSSGYTVNRAYDAYGRITGVTAGASNSVANLTSTFDKLGNLTSRQVVGQSALETFAYDDMNRLTGATMSGITRSVTYNKVGNIMSKTRLDASSLNSYVYATAGKPYAVSSITGSVNSVPTPSFAYDNNGNMTSGAGRTTTWTSYNRVATIAEGTLTLSYVYDAEHQRIKQSDGTVTTRYLNDPIMGFSSEYLTSSGGTNNDYLLADGERVGVRTKKASPSSTVFQGFVQDHLGSVAVVTDNTGAVVQQLAYDAWGRRRNPNGTDDPTGAITAPTTRGFTDHEHLQDGVSGINLVNMNARIYDPEIGRFMSADPIIPDVFASQALNRFSYVYNNPGSMVDPTGFYPICIYCKYNSFSSGDGDSETSSTFSIILRNLYGEGPGVNTDPFPYPFIPETLANIHLISGTGYHLPGLSAVMGTGSANVELHNVPVGVNGDIPILPAHFNYLDGSSTVSASYTGGSGNSLSRYFRSSIVSLPSNRREFIDDGLRTLEALPPTMASIGLIGISRLNIVTKSAAQIAREGGRNSGQLKQFLKQTPEQLQKSIRSFDKKVAQHEGWIKDPTSKVKNFNSLSKEYQGNLIHHWGQDISRAKELKSIAQDVLKGL